MQTSFKLLDEFVDPYQDRQPPWGFGINGNNSIGEITFIRTYSRNKPDGTKERWWEVCRRVIEGMYSIQKDHVKQNKLPWNDRKAQASAQEAFDRMFNLKWTPPGRGLWMMGSDFVMERKMAGAMQNCFTGDTKFITNEFGAIDFESVVDDEVTVWTGKSWERAAIKQFGTQQVQSITFVPFGIRSNVVHTVTATPNHRWILSDGAETVDLKVGDVVNSIPAKVARDTAGYYDGMRHGIIFGDGSQSTYTATSGLKTFFARLVGPKAQHASLFEHKTFPPSGNGDPVVSMKSFDDLKAFPGPDKTNNYVAGFIDGWIATDGYHTKTSICIDSQNPESYSWLVDNAARGSWNVVGHSIVNNKTNFGERSNPLHRIRVTSNVVKFRVSSITVLDEQPVYCAVVPNAGKFVLANGLQTGNCAFVSTADIHKADPGAVFAWVMDALMLGVGVGFDTLGANRQIMIHPTRDVPDDLNTTIINYIIPDTREGWAESVRLLLNSFLRPDQMSVYFDYSHIRQAGEPIKGFGGVSSGPEPLKILHNQLREVIGTRAGEYLDSRAIVDIVNLIGTCVVAGNVRRSATLALGQPTDKEFINLKNADFFPERNSYDPDKPGWGWMSNNSIVADDITDFNDYIDLIADNGEPGFIWLNRSRNYGRLKDEANYKDWRVAGYNPCAEQSLESFEACTLVEIHLNRHDSFDDLKRSLKFAYLYGKTVTLLPTEWEQTNAVMQRNRRIGASLTGIANFADKHGIPVTKKWMDDGYEVIKYYDKQYSEWLGIRESIKTTTVKPSGTVSLLSGASPGVHWSPGGQYYLRAIRFANNDKMLPVLEAAGYKTEPAVQSANTTVVYFPVETDTRSEREVTIFEKMHLATIAQRYWSDNAVSVTVSFDKQWEKKYLSSVMHMFGAQLKTVSFLPMGNDVYPQQPYTSITRDQYEEYARGIKKIDWSGIYENYDDAAGERYCSNDTCML